MEYREEGRMWEWKAARANEGHFDAIALEAITYHWRLGR